jgi:hypothetical protein
MIDGREPMIDGRWSMIEEPLKTYRENRYFFGITSFPIIDHRPSIIGFRLPV